MIEQRGFCDGDCRSPFPYTEANEQISGQTVENTVKISV